MVTVQAQAHDDAELVRRAARGDDQAFSELFSRWFDRVFDVAWYIVHNHDTAAEVAQDAFATAWQQLGTLRRPESFGGWLLRIARNKGLNRLARDGRIRPTGDEEVLVQGDSVRRTGDDPAEPVLATERDDLVWAASAALGVDDTSLLSLHLRHGLEAGELADELGITANAAHQRLHRLRKRMSDAIGAWTLWHGGAPACAGLRSTLAEQPAPAGFDRSTGTLIGVHTRRCAECQERRDRALAPEALFASVPLVTAGPLLRARVAASLGTGGPGDAGRGTDPAADSGTDGPTDATEARADSGTDGLTDATETRADSGIDATDTRADDGTGAGAEGQGARPRDGGGGQLPAPRAARRARTAFALAAGALVVLGLAVLVGSRGGDPSTEEDDTAAVGDAPPADGGDDAEDITGDGPSTSVSPHEAPTAPAPSSAAEAGGLPVTPAGPVTTAAGTVPTEPPGGTPNPPPGEPGPEPTDPPAAAPVVGEFRADPGSGACSGGRIRTLFVWSSVDADTALLGPTGGIAQPVDPSGSFTTCAVPGASWTLRVTGPGGSTPAQTTVPGGPAG